MAANVAQKQPISPDSATLIVRAEVPGFDIEAQVGLLIRLAHPKDFIALRAAETLVEELAAEFRGQLGSVELERGKSKLEKMRAKGYDAFNDWQRRLAAAEVANLKVERAHSMMNDMRAAYVAELSQLRQLVYRRQAAHEAGVDFIPEDVRKFDPADYNLDDSIADVVKQKVGMMQSAWEDKVAELTNACNTVVAELKTRLNAMQSNLQKKDDLLRSVMRKYNYDSEEDLLQRIAMDERDQPMVSSEENQIMPESERTHRPMRSPSEPRSGPARWTMAGFVSGAVRRAVSRPASPRNPQLDVRDGSDARPMRTYLRRLPRLASRSSGQQAVRSCGTQSVIDGSQMAQILEAHGPVPAPSSPSRAFQGCVERACQTGEEVEPCTRRAVTMPSMGSLGSLPTFTSVDETSHAVRGLSNNWSRQEASRSSLSQVAEASMGCGAPSVPVPKTIATSRTCHIVKPAEADGFVPLGRPQPSSAGSSADTKNWQGVGVVDLGHSPPKSAPRACPARKNPTVRVLPE